MNVLRLHAALKLQKTNDLSPGSQGAPHRATNPQKKEEVDP
jgi:hypothetical protein